MTMKLKPAVEAGGCRFAPRQVFVTRSALRQFSLVDIAHALALLRCAGDESDGLDWLQALEREDGSVLWAVDDGDGSVHLLLPEDW